MAEAEDVLTDVARHATAYVQGLWQRRRARDPTPALTLGDIATRLHLLLTAALESETKIRVAQPPAPPSLLTVFFQRHRLPCSKQPVPGTNGVDIILPAQLESGMPIAMQRYRVATLQQAIRAQRYRQHPTPAMPPLAWLVYQLLEAHAADAELATRLPGLVKPIQTLRAECLAARPPLEKLAPYRRPAESFLRMVLQADFTDKRPCIVKQLDIAHIPITPTPRDSAQAALILSEQLMPDIKLARRVRADSLIRDWWTGDLLPLERAENSTVPAGEDDGTENTQPSRSAQLARRPQVREAVENEDDDEQTGMLMFQPDPPEEHAEDPMGMQRPIDRDEQTAAEDFADSLSELPEARLVSQPGRPKEVLLSDDPPPGAAQRQTEPKAGAHGVLQYPEWDYRHQAYRHPGATVRLMPPASGSQAWVDSTMVKHRQMLHAIRKQFEMLQAQRMPLRRQLDGDDIDLEAFIDARADVCAGLPMGQHLYRSVRPARRDMAITLLIDVSGSTDGWVSSHRRVIDVEREALLLVCHALDGLGEPYSVLAFSGNGPDAVTVGQVKHYQERFSGEIALRIAALEPENYTRTGAALRHAAAQLMQQPASHRLLLLLSDGRPNDVDNYEGRYGLEDTRQAITEARLQGIFPFCLTIDRHAPRYLPAIFGAHQYALLPRPEQLPTALVDWMKRLLTR